MNRAHRTVQILAGTYTHTNGTTEQTMIEISSAQWGGGVAKIRMLIDCDALTKTTTWRARIPIDGTNYRALRGPHSIAAADEADQYEEIVSDLAVRFTLQSSANEGASRSIPYKIYIET